MSLYVKRRLTSGRSTFSSNDHVLYHILLFVTQISFDKSLKFWCLSPNWRPSIGIVSGGHPKTLQVLWAWSKVVQIRFGLRVRTIRVRYIINQGHGDCLTRISGSEHTIFEKQFLRRVPLTLEIHLDYSNTAVLCRVAEVYPPASTTTTPHLHSRTSTFPDSPEHKHS